VGPQVTELKEVVKAFHSAGVKVTLDVVHNHTAEGQPSSLTISSAASTVWCTPDQSRNPRYHLDFGAGTASTSGTLMVTKLIIDSLMYRVSEMHVDGFRFDLGSTLRENSCQGVGHSYVPCRQDRDSGSHRLTKRMCAGATLGSSFT